MAFLLDTNFLSETVKPRPNPGVVAWTDQQSPLDLFVSCLTLGEIRKGVDLRAMDARRAEIEAWLNTLIPRQFRGRILPIDQEVALEWGRISADGQRSGRVLPTADGLLIATAAIHGLTIVTRNERDFAHRGVPVLNPWSS